jgi:hypothetical protein
MNNSSFWDVTPCSLLKAKWRFGEAYFYLNGRRAYHFFHTGFFPWLNLQLLRWRWRVYPKCRLTANGLHEIISQKKRLVKFLQADATEWLEDVLLHPQKPHEDRLYDGRNKVSIVKSVKFHYFCYVQGEQETIFCVAYNEYLCFQVLVLL